jgi:hypothetical protein
MSDHTVDLEYRETLARIDKTQAETHKYVAETIKLSAEARKVGP